MRITGHTVIYICVYLLEAVLASCPSQYWSWDTHSINCSSTGCVVIPVLDNTTCFGNILCINDVWNDSSYTCSIGCNPVSFNGSVNANSVNCSTAEKTGDTCEIDSDCDGNVTCINGTYSENLVCSGDDTCIDSYLPSKNIATYISNYSIAVNCDVPLNATETCEVTTPDDVECDGEVYCTNGTFKDNNLICRKLCNENFTSPHSYVTTDCTAAQQSGTACLINTTNASCIGSVMCKDEGYVSTLNCNQWCSGIYTSPIAGINVDCSNAIGHLSNCTHNGNNNTNQCIGEVHCNNGTYFSNLQCTKLCDPNLVITNGTLQTYKDMGVSINCSTATHDNQLCRVEHQPPVQCNGSLTCESGLYNSTLSCTSLCDGNYGRSTQPNNILGIDCSRALVNQAECDISSSGPCTGSVKCTELGYATNITCASRICTGLAPIDPLYSYHGVTVNCSSALQPGQSCTTVRSSQSTACDGGFWCLANGTYLANFSCDGCTGVYVRANEGAFLVNCSNATKEQDLCTLDAADNRPERCGGEIVCSSKGYESSIVCGTPCSGNFNNITLASWGVTANCSAAKAPLSSCSLDNTAQGACSGNVTCLVNGDYLSSVNCTQTCSGFYLNSTIDSLGITANCSSAIQPGQFCKLSNDPSATCSGEVTCTPNGYQSTVGCLQGCNGLYQNSTYDLGIDCSSAVVSGAACSYAILDHTLYNYCDGEIICSGGNYKSNVTCTDWCDGQFYNNSIDSSAVSIDCSRATHIGNECIMVTFSGRSCHGNVTCTQVGYQSSVECNTCSGLYKSPRIDNWGLTVNCSQARQPGSVCTIESLTTDRYVCTGEILCDSNGTNYQNLITCLQKCSGFYSNSTLDAWNIAYDCSQSLLPGSACLTAVPTSGCTGSLSCLNGTYESHYLCNTTCDGNYQNGTLDSMFVNYNCSNALREGELCEVNALFDRCSNVSIVCSQGSYQLRTASCDCGGIYSNSTFDSWGKNVNCTAAKTQGQECSISDRNNSHICSGSVVCNSSSYHSSLSCSPKCSALYFNTSFINWDIWADCKNVFSPGETCHIVHSSPDYDCHGNVICGISGSYTSSVSCAHLCSGSYISPNPDIAVDCSRANYDGELCAVTSNNTCSGNVTCTDGFYQDNLRCISPIDCNGTYIGEYSNFVDCSLAMYDGNICFPAPSANVTCDVSISCQSLSQFNKGYVGNVSCVRVPGTCPACPCSNLIECDSFKNLTSCPEGPPCCPEYTCASSCSICDNKCLSSSCFPLNNCTSYSCVDKCVPGGSCPVTSTCKHATCINGSCIEENAPDSLHCGKGGVCMNGICNDACETFQMNCDPGRIIDVECQWYDCINRTCAIVFAPDLSSCNTIPLGVCYSGFCVSSCSSNGMCPPPPICKSLICMSQPCQPVPLPVGSTCGFQGGKCDNRQRCVVDSCLDKNIICPTPPRCMTYNCDFGNCNLENVLPGTKCDENMVCDGSSCVDACKYFQLSCDSFPDCSTADCTKGTCNQKFQEGIACNDNGICSSGECLTTCEYYGISCFSQIDECQYHYCSPPTGLPSQCEIITVSTKKPCGDYLEGVCDGNTCVNSCLIGGHNCGEPPSECSFYNCTGGSCVLTPKRFDECGPHKNGFCNTADQCIDSCDYFQLQCNIKDLSECQYADCTAGTCHTAAAADNTRCSIGVCYSGICIDSCSYQGIGCQVNASNCSYYSCLNGAVCQKLQSPNGTGCENNGTCNGGICTFNSVTTSVCKSSRVNCPFPKECVDQHVGDTYKCVCPSNYTTTTDGDCVSINICTPHEIAKCQAMYSTCKMINTSLGIPIPKCTTKSCTVELCNNIPLGCRKKDRSEQQHGPDGCPLVPCDYICDGCSTKHISTCQIKGRIANKQYECVTFTSTFQCVEVTCPTVKCPTPPDGCHTEAVTIKAGDRCPSQPCGRLICPNTTCLEEKRVQCAALTPRRDCVVISDNTGVPVSSCVPFVCPIVSCSSTPPGCHFVITNNTKIANDQYGCPEYPCGSLQCAELPVLTCSDSERQICCNNNSCTDCVLNPDGGQPTCVEHNCQTAQTCFPTSGCHFETNTAKGLDGCPLYPCGTEICKPYDVCEPIIDIEVCPPGYSCSAIQGKSQCDEVRQCLDKCQFGMICVDGTCKPSDICFDQVCPAGMTCFAESLFSQSTCVSMQHANCPNARECTKKGGSCLPVLLGSSSITKYECFVKERCSLDECACSGKPCSSSEGCFIHKGKATCMPVQGIPQFKLLDLCAAVVCPSELERCIVTQGVTSCVSNSITVSEDFHSCGVCLNNQTCDKISKQCINPTCRGCRPTESCSFVNGRSMCVVNKCNHNSQNGGFVWPPETCISDSECSSGEVCPRATSDSLSGIVSAWCSCDPLTGQPETCSSRRLYGSRYCVPRKWDCSVDWNLPEYQNSTRRTWCCLTLQIGCTHYNCIPAEHEEPETWPTVKASYCCKKNGIGCPVANYNCRTSEEWGYDKRFYCCERKGIGCPVDRYRCEGKLSKESAVWCCRERSIGCNTELTNVYNCSTSEIWSLSKSDYCCRVYGLKCEVLKTYHDCHTSNPITWSEPHRHYCCKHTSTGCSSSAPPYDCQNKQFLLDNKNASDWCCLFHEMNCPAQLQYQCDETSQASDRCCSRCNKKCYYTCPADFLQQRYMIDEQRSFCCDQKGVACYGVQPAVVNGTRYWKNFNLLISASWNRISNNPKEYARRLRTTLQAVVSHGETNLLLKEIGPAIQLKGKPGYQRPSIGSDLDMQKFTIPDTWQQVSPADRERIISHFTKVVGKEDRSISTLAENVFSSNPEVGTNAVFVSFTIDAPQPTVLDSSQQEVQLSVTDAVSKRGVFAQNSGGSSYVLSPLPSGEATGNPLIETGLSGSPEPSTSSSGSPVVLIVCLVLVGVGIVSLTSYKVLFRKKADDPGESVFTFEMLRYTASDSSSSVDGGRKVIEEGNI